jgi:diguanylate cyclase (GGDEF)-like protein
VSGAGPWTDRSLWLGGGLLAAVVLAYLPGLLPTHQLEEFSESYSVVLIVVTIVFLKYRFDRLPSPHERAFWNLWALAYAVWLIPSVWDQFIGYADYQEVAVNLVQDVLYLGFYALVILALETMAHRRAGPHSRGWLRRFGSAGGIVFTFALLFYFVVVPAAAQPDDYRSQLPSFVFYVLLDLYVVVRLVILRRSSHDRRWRSVYAWLLAAACFWMVGDTVNLLMWSGLVPWVASGTPLDFLWLPQYACVWIAARLREPEGKDDEGTDIAFDDERHDLPGGALLGYAVWFLVLHFAVSMFGGSGPVIRLARDVCAFGVLMVMTGLAIVRQKVLEREAEKVREQRLRAAQAEHRAYHDALTGLPNRYLFLDRLERAVTQAARTKTRVAVLFLDLDRFKTINDSLGHTAGDHVLREVGRRVEAAVRASDSVARIGGDEYMVLSSGVRDEEDAMRIAVKVLDCLRVPVVLEGQEIFVNASLGVSLYPTDGENPETLVKNADAALHRAKEMGGNRHQMYHADLNRRALERLQLESDLRHAVSRDEFLLHYQPIFEMPGNRFCGCEALLRWNHPQRGVLGPGAFIKVAEITGILAEINPWLLRSACRDARRFEDVLGRPVSVAVNASARQFMEPGLVSQVQGALRESGLDAGLLEIEITESLAMEKAEATVRTLERLKALGVKISIDDFGTGYSSLAYLPQFPIDTLKIDRSFISPIERPGDAAIVATVVALARTIGVKTVAEGVETQEQLTAVGEEGCDRVQGFLLGHPLPREELEERILGGRM